LSGMPAHAVNHRQHITAGNLKRADSEGRCWAQRMLSKADAQESSHLGGVCHKRVQPPAEQHVEEEACGAGQRRDKVR
jgi:hypothetical protein